MIPPSNHPTLVAYLANHPESCAHALQAARNLPPVDLQTLDPIPPPTLRVLANGQITSLQPDLAWLARFGPTHPQSLVLVDAVERFEPARVWSWPRLRAGLRLQARCPTWLLVYSPRQSVLAAIEHGFTHQRELMPILFGPERVRFNPDPVLVHPASPACRLLTT